MLAQMIEFFLSAFRFTDLIWSLIILAIAIGFLFGAIWLISYWPPLVQRPWLWAVSIVSALFTWSAIAFIQVPLQTWAGQALLYFWGEFTLLRWLLLAGIPQILLSGLVQEGSKLVPTVFYWWRSGRSLDPKFGLLLGAMAGAGFGVFEAVWVHNSIFASGWTWQTVETSGLMALLGFGERFFTVAFHIAVSALAGYGLAKGQGWQFYLLASFLHGATNYSVILLQKGLLSTVQVEIYIVVFALAITAAALRLRWRNPQEVSQDTQQSYL